MVERFTERARKVIELAEIEARHLKHNYIGTEHLLLGLIAEGEGLAAVVLDALGVELEATRAQIAKIVGQGDKEDDGRIPFSPQAKRVLDMALREALSLGHNYIGTEHLLLGLVREDAAGTASRILMELDVGLKEVREQIIKHLRKDLPKTPVVSVTLAEAEQALKRRNFIRTSPLVNFDNLTTEEIQKLVELLRKASPSAE